ncbi:MAG: tail fiber protein [Lacunisphaera sp.]|nr:tail fiber protein [Lacunisphaera sp.]
MILSTVSRVTGLPLVKEGRNDGGVYHALPRKFLNFTFGLRNSAKQTWIHEWQRWEMDVLHEVRCWKCGREIKGWRMALDRRGQPIKVGGSPAVTFTTLNHFAQTPMLVRWPQLDRTAVFSVLHCADCVVEDQHGMEAMSCFLQGLDAQLQRAWRANKGQQLTRDDWASHLYLWRDAEPAGVEHGMQLADRLDSLNSEIAKLAKEGPVRLPVPGELITAAHYLTDVFAWQFTGVPCGVMMKYAGGSLPAGYLRCTGGPIDAAQWPELAKKYGTLPDEPDHIIKT